MAREQSRSTSRGRVAPPTKQKKAETPKSPKKNGEITPKTVVKKRNESKSPARSRSASRGRATTKATPKSTSKVNSASKSPVKVVPKSAPQTVIRKTSRSTSRSRGTPAKAATPVKVNADTPASLTRNTYNSLATPRTAGEIEIRQRVQRVLQAQTFSAAPKSASPVKVFTPVGSPKQDKTCVLDICGKTKHIVAYAKQNSREIIVSVAMLALIAVLIYFIITSNPAKVRLTIERLPGQIHAAYKRALVNKGKFW